MSRSKKSLTSPQKTSKRNIVASFFRGYAVVFLKEGVVTHSEFWAYDPALLSDKQRKMLGILSWKRFEVAVGVHDRG